MIRFNNPLMMSWLVCLALFALTAQAIATDQLHIGFEEKDKLRLTDMNISSWKSDQRGGDKARIMLAKQGKNDAHALIDLQAYTPEKQYDHLTLRAFVHGDYHPKQVGHIQITVSADGVTYHPVKLSAKRESKFHGGWHRYQLTATNTLKPFRYVKMHIIDIPVYWRLELADLWLANGSKPVITEVKNSDKQSQDDAKSTSLLPANQTSNVPLPTYALNVGTIAPSSNTINDILICPLNPADESLHADAVTRYPWVASRINESDYRNHTWKHHPNLKIGNETQTVLYRFAIDITQWPGHGQIRLELDQCAFVTTVWVNGKQGPTIREGLLPIAFDLTPLIMPGDKKLDVVLHVQDYRKQIDQTRNYPTMPLGAMFKWTMGVIIPPRITWQSELHLETPFIFSDVMQNKLTTQATLVNDSDQTQQGTLHQKVVAADGVLLLEHKQQFDIPAGKTKQLSHTYEVSDKLKRWDIGKPNLYFAVNQIHIAGKVVDQRRTRFGYRTVALDGEDILLNGRKIQLVGPWSHIGQWCWPAVKGYDIAEAYRLMLKHGMNYGRLHGQPYPKIFYDTADEVGFLLVAESGLFHRPIADISLDHIRNMALTLRNHPSIVMWSGSNEFEHWITPRPKPAMDFLIKVHDTFKSVDPTRAVYHSGFGDARNHFDAYSIHYPELMRTYPQGLLWKQYAPERIKLLQRHTFESYNPIGKKPILVGEQMTPGRERGMEALLGEEHLKIQYQGSNAAYLKLLKNQGTVWADMIRVYREQNIAMLSPNMMHIPTGVESPFLIEIGKELRGVSCYIKQRNPILTTGSTQQRTLVIRDTDGYVDAGKVRITLTAQKQLLYAHQMDVTLQSNESMQHNLNLDLPTVAQPTHATISIQFTDQGQDTPRYQWQQSIKLYPPTLPLATLSKPILFWAQNQKAIQTLKQLGINAQSVEDLPRQISPQILVIDSSITNEQLATKAKLIESHVTAGGAVLLLPRATMPDGLLPVACDKVDNTLPGLEGASIGFVRAKHHPIFADTGIDTLDLRYWGKEHELISQQSIYKPTQGNFQVLIDAGEKLEDALLMQIQHGKGRYMVCQLDALKHAASHPAAAKVLLAILSDLDQSKNTVTQIGYYLPQTETFTKHLLQRMGWQELDTTTDTNPHALLIDSQAMRQLGIDGVAMMASKSNTVIFKHLTADESQLVIKQMNLPEVSAKEQSQEQPKRKRRGLSEAVYLSTYPASMDGLNSFDVNWYQRLRPSLTQYQANEHWQVPLSTGTIAIHQDNKRTVIFDASLWNQEVDLLDQRDRFISTFWTNLGIQVKGAAVRRRSSNNHYTQLDISALCNTSIAKYLGPNIPRGKVALNDIPFRLLPQTPQQQQTMIRFNGRIGSELQDKPVMFDTAIDKFEQTTPMSLSLPIAREHASHLYFAHASSQNWKIKSANTGMLVYRVEVEYENGTTQQIPMLINRDINDCRSASAQSRNSPVGLRVQNPNNGNGEVATVYLSTWTNPYPERKITQITLRSAANPPYDAMIFAITMRQADEAYE